MGIETSAVTGGERGDAAGDRPWVSGVRRRLPPALRPLARRAAGWVRMGRRLVRHHRLERFDFQSGLGDSAWLLYGLVRAMKPRTCVEIGSARGRSAAFIALALADNGGGRLYAIDPHCQTSWNDSESVDTYAYMTRMLKKLGVDEYVTIIREESDVAARGWEGGIDLLFIDGDHSYEGAKQDWSTFAKYVGHAGVVVFHDTMWDIAPEQAGARPDMGVPRLVDELRLQGYPVVSLAEDYGVSVVQPVVGGAPLRRAAVG
jgi:predicted O-methyltransferase YrrM